MKKTVQSLLTKPTVDNYLSTKRMNSIIKDMVLTKFMSSSRFYGLSEMTNIIRRDTTYNKISVSNARLVIQAYGVDNTFNTLHYENTYSSVDDIKDPVSMAQALYYRIFNIHLHEINFADYFVDSKTVNGKNDYYMTDYTMKKLFDDLRA